MFDVRLQPDAESADGRGACHARYALGAVVPFGWQWGLTLPGGDDVELATGQTLFVLAVLIFSVLAVMWILAATRRSHR